MDLGPTRYCESEDPAITAIAERLTQEDDESTSRELFSFTRDLIEYNIQRRLKGARRTLQAEDGMCFDKTNLLIALHRAAGIPARYRQMRCSLDVNDPSLPADAFHLIAEVRIEDDWIPLDPSFDTSIEELIAPSRWAEPSWTTIQSQQTYTELPRHLPYMVNYVLRFMPKIRTIQTAIDDLRDR